MKIINLFCLAFLLICFTANNVFSHRVNVFAWVENDKIAVEANFGQSRPAMDAQVTVLDPVTNKVLLKGNTDAKGVFTFPFSSLDYGGNGLNIDVNAGEGHQSSWKMSAEELAPLISTSKVSISEEKKQTEAIPDAVPLVSAQKENGEKALASDEITALLKETVRSAVNEAISTQLAPIRRELASQMTKDPGITEIIGGIGWIIGIIGVALYYKSRQK